MQVPKGLDQVSGGVSVPCRHATPVADALWKPIFINNDKVGKKSNQGALPYLTSYVGRYVVLDLNFYCTVLYIAIMLYLTAEPRGRPVASSMYRIIFIKTENIAVDEIGRVICSYLLARNQ